MIFLDRSICPDWFSKIGKERHLKFSWIIDKKLKTRNILKSLIEQKLLRILHSPTFNFHFFAKQPRLGVTRLAPQNFFFKYLKNDWEFVNTYRTKNDWNNETFLFMLNKRGCPLILGAKKGQKSFLHIFLPVTNLI